MEFAQTVANVKRMYTQYPFPPVTRSGSYKIYAQFIRRLFADLSVDIRGKKILDAGCGTGVMLCDLAEEIPEAEFTGIDLSRQSLDILRQSLSKKKLGNVRFHEDNLMALKLTDKFDLIYSWGVLHHTPNASSALHNLSQRLNTHGIFMGGVYGFFGNWERRLQQELVSTIVPDKTDLGKKLRVLRHWIDGDRKYFHLHTEPKTDLSCENWLVDEFSHVHEQHIHLRDLAKWYRRCDLDILQLTDYYTHPISLNIKDYSHSEKFIDEVNLLAGADRLHIIELLVRPYWLCLVGRKHPHY